MPDRRWAQRAWRGLFWFGLALIAWGCGKSSAASQQQSGSSGDETAGSGGVVNAGMGGGGDAGATANGGANDDIGGAAGSSESGGTAGATGGNSGMPGSSGAAGATNDGDAGARCLRCDGYTAAAQAGAINENGLSAISGIAASAANPGVLYVHNDRDQAEFFAVDEQGTLLGTFTLQDTAVLDVEDIAVGPCPQGSCVYLADLGDNVTPRQEYQILRVAEPSVTAGSPGADQALSSELLIFSYPDGTHNAESLLIDHATQELYVVTKEAAGMPSAVYRLQSAFTAAVGGATKVADLTVPGPNDTPATAADAHPCGVAFLLRTNNTLYEFRIAEGAPFESLFAATPAEVPFGDEQQGEAVTYSRDGLGYFTTSEGTNPPIHRTDCRP
ncbi:MAG TPA: hypothetical protein VHO25_19460 [Polyangiaceae bacterium]|nr:hypothetical protein [Polyangiaceae bacterium]